MGDFARELSGQFWDTVEMVFDLVRGLFARVFRV